MSDETVTGAASSSVIVDQPILPDGTAVLPSDDATEEKVVAVRSALILGLSLLATWAVGLLGRMFLPRFLGPTRFGVYSVAEIFPLAFFAFLGLGVETYAQKELPVRPKHATDFFGGLVVVRVVLAVALFGGMVLELHREGADRAMQMLVLVFGVGQFLVIHNGTLASMLQSTRNVGGLAIANVAAKLTWGACLLAAILTKAPLVVIASVLAVSETIKAVWLQRLARTHMDLRAKIDFGAVRHVVSASAPYYVNAIAIGIYSRIDVWIVNRMTGSKDEAGFYGSAQSLAGLTMLLTPLLGSVLLPLMSRVALRSRDELDETLRRTLEQITAVTIPVSLMMYVGAEFAVHYGLGKSFLAAAPAVAILAPMFVLTYVAMIMSLFLMMIDRAWTVTIVSVFALVIDASLNVVLVPRCYAKYGAGGGGIGGSIALLVTEVFVVVAMTRVTGLRTAWSARSAMNVAKAVIIALVVVAADRAMFGLGYVRLVLDGLLYLALAIPTKALDVRQIVGAIRSSRRG